VISTRESCSLARHRFLQAWTDSGWAWSIGVRGREDRDLLLGACGAGERIRKSKTLFGTFALSIVGPEVYLGCRI